jgi:sporulation-control protein spo0M
LLKINSGVIILGMFKYFLKFFLTYILLFSFYPLNFVLAEDNLSFSTTTKINSEELIEINKKPSVTIGKFLLEKYIYSPGEEISGSLIVGNDLNYNLPDLTYKISLIDNSQKDQEKIVYDTKIYKSFLLKALEKKEIKFNYLLPNNVTGKDLSVQIQFFTSTGLSLSNSNKKIQIEGGLLF